MLSIYISEDNPLQLNQYKSIIENIILMENYDMSLQAAVSNPEELLSIARRQHANATDNCAFYLLDIDLKTTLDGFDVAQAIREFDSRGFIVFITTHSELAMLTFKYQVEALDFILKDNPWSIGPSIRSCLEVANKRYNTNSQVPMLAFRNGEQTIYIEQERIQYIASAHSPHKVIVVTDRSISEFYGSLRDCLDKLPASFIRCHKGYIVNVKNVSSINRKTHEITLENHQTCYCSARKLPILIRALEQNN